jgi:hypothetical protein
VNSVRNQTPTTLSAPLAVSVQTAGRLLGLSKPSAYRLARSGSLPILPIPGRKKVSVAKLAELVGRQISAEEIARADIP